MVSHIRSDSDDLLLDERVRALLAAASAPTEPGPVAGEDEVLAAFRSAHRRRRIPMLGRLTPARTAVAATIGAGAFLAAGVGAAAAGTLPGAAQGTAHDWLASVGIEVPGANSHASGHADQRGGTEDADETDATETDTGDTDGADAGAEKQLPPAAAHGQEVSGVAKGTDAQGADKGAEVSGTASAGRSKAGEERTTGSRPEGSGDEGATRSGEGSTKAGEHSRAGGRRP